MALPGGVNKVPQDKKQDAEYLASVGLVATNNNKGHMFLQVDGYVESWLSSLPDSDKPLADLGCAFGVHTVHALRHGRDVIAVDMERSHIVTLETTIRAQRGLAGRLVATRVARLPQSDLFESESLAGVLLSELLHFLTPGEPGRVFADVFKWLQPGGRVVVSTASDTACASKLACGATMRGGDTEDEIMRFIQSASDEDLVREAPTFATYSTQSSDLSHLYYFSTRELAAHARLAGFHIENLHYYSPQKYQVTYSEENDAVLLIARKPQP